MITRWLMFHICGNLMLLYFLEMKLSSVYIFTEWQIFIWQKYYFAQFILSINDTFWAPTMVSTLKNTVQTFFLFLPGTYLVLFYLNSLFTSVLTTYNALFSIYLYPIHPLRPRSSVFLANPLQTTSGLNDFSFL